MWLRSQRGLAVTVGGGGDEEEGKVGFKKVVCVVSV